MTSEAASRGVRACLLTLAVVALVLVAFAAGFTSGHRLTTAPVAEQESLNEATQTPPTPAPSAVPTEAVSPTRAPSPVTREPSPTAGPSAGTTFDLYWEVWALIEQDFYGALPGEVERTHGAIRGSLRTLNDDYTAFIEPEVAQILRSDRSGSFEGIGAHVRTNEFSQVVIVRPLAGRPAEAAGLRAGDVVLAADGHSLEGMSLYEAIQLIRGPEGTPVVLTIMRAGLLEPFDVEIMRERIPLPTVEWEMLEGDIGYIRLYEFNEQATARLQDALEALLAEEATALILDLRDNPGGLLNQAVSVADEFLSAGVVVSERGSQGLDKVFESSDEGLAEEIPLAVLINAGSASGSEIVAGAIQDRGRAMLVGETSFGKGSVQQAHRLSDGSELRVTIARWFTPKDRAIHGAGLVPDIQVPITEEHHADGVDPQLQRAIEYLLTSE